MNISLFPLFLFILSIFLFSTEWVISQLDLSFISGLLFLVIWILPLILFFNSSNRGSLIEALILLLCLILSYCFQSERSLGFYICFELRLVPTFMLIYIYGYQPEKVSSVLFLVIYIFLFSLPFLFLILFYYFPSIGLFSLCIDVLSVLSLCGFRLVFIVKTPLFFFHLWLPKAHVEAPVAGSIILASLLLKLGTIGCIIIWEILVIRFTTFIYFFLSLSGGLICRFLCLRSIDMKSIIAYSSVVHIGVVTIGWLSLSYSRKYSLLFITFGHGLSSPLLFAASYILYKVYHRRRLLFSKGVLFSLFSFTLFILLTINAGFPPRLNLWAEICFITHVILSRVWLSIILGFIAFFTFLYNINVYVILVSGKMASFGEVNYTLWYPLVITPIYYSYFRFLRFRMFTFINP